jgi:hypothetical protein
MVYTYPVACTPCLRQLCMIFLASGQTAAKRSGLNFIRFIEGMVRIRAQKGLPAPALCRSNLFMEEVQLLYPTTQIISAKLILWIWLTVSYSPLVFSTSSILQLSPIQFYSRWLYSSHFCEQSPCYVWQVFLYLFINFLLQTYPILVILPSNLNDANSKLWLASGVIFCCCLLYAKLLISGCS